MKVLKFSASWCMPCKALTQTIKTLTPEQQSLFEEIDIDTCDKTLLSQYNVRSVPTLVFLSDSGSILRQTSGMMPKDKLISYLS